MKHLKRYKIYEDREYKTDLIRSIVLDLKSKFIQTIWDILLEFKDDGLDIDFYLLMKGIQFSEENLDIIYMFKVDEDENGIVLSTKIDEEYGYSYFDDDYFDDGITNWILRENDPNLLIDENLIFLLNTYCPPISKEKEESVHLDYINIEKRLKSIFDINLYENRIYFGNEKRMMFSAKEK